MRMKAFLALSLVLYGLLLLHAAPAPAAPACKKVPLIDVTDLYHPPQDPGDNLDLIAEYALPEVDLRAVVLDCTAAFRKPVADFGGLPQDPTGPRDPGFIPITQLNYVFNRAVPCAAAPFQTMKSPQDKMLDAPAFQQQGVELILKTLRGSAVPVEIVSFGSARPVAVAFNRGAKLFRKKLRRLHLCAGASDPGYVEWNVALDTNAIVCLLRSSLPIALYPCATKDGPFAYGANNCYWQLPDLRFIGQMQPSLRRYLGYAFSRSQRVDFLRALEEEWPAETMEKVFWQPHNVWETSVWLSVSGRRLVRRADGRHRIVTAAEVLPTDTVLPNELLPCRVRVNDNGTFTWEKTTQPTNFRIYDRGDPEQNQRALREALPALYISFVP
jgi:pyrimidine-specific ribonucleoside hydrolase